MEVPQWAALVLRWLALPGEADDVIGDLEEAHRRRLRQHRPLAAIALTNIEALELAAALLRARAVTWRIRGHLMIQDYKLGLRMLVKYPGLTIAGGLALAIAIGIGAGWYDLMRDLMRPTLPLPEGNRIVEIEMRNSMSGQDERRLLHDFLTWKRELRSLTDVGAYQSLERNLVLGDARPQPVPVAEITASAFQMARVPPVLGRYLVEADEEHGAPPIVVIGHSVWQRQFGGRSDVIGQTIQLGRTKTTIVGVMPEGFTFPVNHRMWTPLRTRASGYAPLEGPPIRVFGRLAPGRTQVQAYAEVMTIAERVATELPQTHGQLRPRVLAYGGESPGDRTWLEFALRHLPILLVLLVACANVGTLIYARTATREAEIATRYALGAGRGRIVMQLFVEALALASVAAVVGLTAAHYALKWGMDAYYSGQDGGAPFWVNPGLKLDTIGFAAVLTVLGAAMLSILPALKVTGGQMQTQMRHLGVGGATLRFGALWTTAMVAQVALTVMCLPPAAGITQESIRDRAIRERFPAENYLAVRLDLDRDNEDHGAPASDRAHASRFERTLAELQRRLAAEPGVVATTFADRLPGMDPEVRTAEVEASPQSQPTLIPNLWLAAVGPHFFQAFDVPIVAGRDFDERDRRGGANTVLVNEAFARRYVDGASPVGARVRFAGSDPATQEEWFEVIGMFRDVGMTPTDLGEAPYMVRPASLESTRPLVMAVRVAGDAREMAARVRVIAAEVDLGLRLSEIRSLEDLVWRVDVPMMIGAGAIVTVVALGLFLSAAGIFSLVSVSVARRTREIGLRTALGASRGRLLAGVFTRAAALVGSGVLVGNAILMLFISVSDEVAVADVLDVLATTSVVMMAVGLVACLEPARRALRIQPIDALKQG